MNAETQIFVFIAMVFCHIFDDYYLQGRLTNMKQKSWWAANAPDPMYKSDYIVALVVHAFSWSFMVLLPVLITTGWLITKKLLVVFVVNWLVHGIVDDLKANRKAINLITDQGIHLIQILFSWAVLV